MHQPPIPQIDAEDPEIAGLIHDEARRQQDKFRLIASENYVSTAVLEASGTLLTNKYSEGYPGKRYYEGQQFIDPIESIAVSRRTPYCTELNHLPPTATPAPCVRWPPIGSASPMTVSPGEANAR